MKIALLCGGVSAEREISLASGRKIAEALRSRNHEVIVIDPSFGVNQIPENELFSFSIGESVPTEDGTHSPNKRLYIQTVDEVIPDNTDVVFVILHGTFGEDGYIQSLLELCGFPYTGSGVLASALAMDKSISKALFKQAGIPTPTWIVVEKNTYKGSTLKSIIQEKFGYPAVIKPSNQGSTVGLTIIQSEKQLDHALSVAWKFSERVIIEAYIPGREMTVAILGDEPLPVIEIKPKEGFYDYKHKYTPGHTEYLVPAPIKDEVAQRLQDVAICAYKTLGCRGFGRVDFRLTDTDEPYCLEVNTLPGLTDTSLVPKAAKAVGIDYPELCERIVEYALEGK